MTAVAVDRHAAPSVSVHAPSGVTSAVVIVLPGGKADSFAPTNTRQLTRLRMLPFARQLARRGGRHGLEVWTLRYRYRGWNGPHMSPVQDAQWALDEVRHRHGDMPVVLVGHSMGGRTALRVAGDAAVVGVVALAPWLNDSEPVAQLRHTSVLIAHGSADMVTSPSASERFARRIEPVARAVDYVRVCGEMHAMIFRPWTWRRLTTGYVLDLLEIRPMSRWLRRGTARGHV